MKTISVLALSLCSLSAADFQLDFNSHLNFAVGSSNVDEPSLATHGHDPNDEFTVQGLELNGSVRYGEHLAGFVSYNSFLDSANKVDGELEEAFLKLEKLPAGFELRAGRLLNRVSTQNNQHLHSWHYADANLITTRFLGEEGLVSESIELSYRLPVDHDAILSVAFGDAPPHEEEEGGHDPAEVEGEESALSDDIFTARLKGIYHHTDFYQYTYGLSYLHGTNGYGRTTSIGGADLNFLWRENGLEKGGKYFRATLEAIYRDFSFINENGDVSGSADEWGIHSSVGWSPVEQWELGLRHDYLQGVEDPVEELPKRNRTSAAVTRSFEYNEHLSGHVRLQYNYDWSNPFAHDHALWLQFQFDFGTGGEIR